jgi:hypothetical protein
MDAKMNGDETGVDCGGSCQRLCNAESLPLVLKGDPRILTIATSTYEVVALLDNPNQSAEIYKASYTLKLYDAKSAIPVKLIEGTTFVPKGETFAIFEGPFTLQAGIIPVRATLEWQKNTLVWRKNPNNYPAIEVKEDTLSNEKLTPRLDAVVKNSTLAPIANIDLIALIADADGNIFAASKTFIDTLAVGEESAIVFTWPRPFTSQAVDIKIIKRIFPDGSFIR